MTKRRNEVSFCSCEFPFPGSKGIIQINGDEKNAPAKVGGQLCSTCGHLRWILTDPNSSEFQITVDKGQIGAML